MKEIDIRTIPSVCPHCGSDNIENDEAFYDDEGGQFSQTIQCNDCNAEWALYYSFDYWIPV